jgi:hypothetical protein
MSNYYSKTYFGSNIFDYDYKPIADAIYEAYKPKSVIEFGCGNGGLAKAFSHLPITSFLAIDGYAQPDFTGYENIKFIKIDLNDVNDIEAFLSSVTNQHFDIAISTEVAEHLKPEVSEALIKALTTCADTVVFSAAVPGQDGDGHINCQTRSFWDSLFEKRSFYMFDTIRKNIRSNKKVGRWYQLNICDYRKIEGGPSKEQYTAIVKNLIGSESAASSFFYVANRRYNLLKQWLHLDVIAFALKLRNSVKRIVGKKPLKEEIED